MWSLWLSWLLQICLDFLRSPRIFFRCPLCRPSLSLYTRFKLEIRTSTSTFNIFSELFQCQPYTFALWSLSLVLFGVYLAITLIMFSCSCFRLKEKSKRRVELSEPSIPWSLLDKCLAQLRGCAQPINLSPEKFTHLGNVYNPHFEQADPD